MTDTEKVRDLRALADFIEAHPGMGSMGLDTAYFHPHGDEEIAATVKAFGGFSKRESTDGTDLLIERRLTPTMEIAAFLRRDRVCVRKVVGTKLIEETIIPERVVPAHIEDIVEWDCKPVLEAIAQNDEREP